MCIYLCVWGGLYTCVGGCECMHYDVTATTLACLLTALANSLVLNKLLPLAHMHARFAEMCVSIESTRQVP